MWRAMLIALTYVCRTSATATFMRSSSVAYAEFRKFQLEHIRDNLEKRAQREGRERAEEVDSDDGSVSAEEVPDDEYKEHEERRPVMQLLQLVKPVDTRWNSTMYMIQR